MKKIVVAVLLVAFTFPAFTQETTGTSVDKNVVKINTLSLLVGTGSVFYERKLTDNASAQMGVGYLNYKFSGTTFSGIFLTPEFRYYPKGNAIDGFYLAPYMRYNKYSLNNGSDNADYTNVGGGALIGHQWISNSGFTMDLFFGGHYGSGKITGSSNGEPFDTDRFEGFRIRVGFALGFSF